ncbi:MAG: hypothetical protein ACLP2X_21380 [Syntrophobacteraceae bacterium]
MKTGAATPGMRFGAAVVSALALLLFASGSVFAEGQARRNILVISPFDRSLPFSLSFFSGLNSALEPHDLNTFEFFQENLDVDRIQNGEYLDSLAAFLNSKYAGKKFDAIVTLNEWALDFLIGRCGSISPGTPVVAAGVSREKSAGERAGREIIPVWSEGDTAERTIDLILHLQPKAKKIYIVLGAHPYERARWSYLREALTSYTNGPEFVFIPNSRYEEVLGAVRRLNANDAVLVLLFMRRRWQGVPFAVRGRKNFADGRLSGLRDCGHIPGTRDSGRRYVPDLPARPGLRPGPDRTFRSAGFDGRFGRNPGPAHQASRRAGDGPVGSFGKKPPGGLRGGEPVAFFIAGL